MKKQYSATFFGKSSGYQCKYADNDMILWCLMCPLRDISNLDQLITNFSTGDRGYGGNLTFVRIENNLAIITSLLFEDDYELEIPFDKFMKFLHDWQKATKDNPDEITLYRDDDYNIWIETYTTCKNIP